MQLYLNNFSTTLVAPAEAGALNVPVADAERLVGLGGGNYYCLTAVLRNEQGHEVAWEIFRVTGRSGGTLTVTGGQEGTTALDLPAGTELHMRLTAAALIRLQQQIDSLSARLAALEAPGPGAGALLDANGNQLTDNLGEVLTGANA
ncbi:hypothetical protein [Ectopseudomonas mendocina]|uniref:hypothetical protein n=1 Tax=Ectopseudomonas mendocina TaxID=300 RepID=UPI003F0D742B